ncbi:bifunctional riboflavin kinase/FAD synthetase [Paenibacillus piri]|uniref:Riboflavin biosynthesis protein n=1 Tax=Paenibacillus piri TaxID=2547395 RepID=A0A4R5KR09_9BACL|nr:bifunctional riboflavin kinase/FAD synthetase [Paenibacillus piri]TDF98181.1 bifunctional riboflavin kinase/FAD synthetase [Paenibacillus piri]
MQSLELIYPIARQTNLSAMVPQVIAIGDFDGVHLGHQEVIRRAIQTAGELGIPASIMTFNPHPREVLGQCKYIKLLTPVEQKKRLMAELGVNNTYIVSFNQQLMMLTPAEFVENVLVPMKVNTVIVGFDFRFGYRGAGDPDTLCELAQGRFAVEVIRPFHQSGSKVSSTRVRDHLLSGELEQANALLGRPYSLNGIVVTGDGRGKTIGFPTANIDVQDPFLIPAIGVYAVRVSVQGHLYDGVMNVGKKPTFETELEQPTLEAHLFDFSETIYGETVSVEFIRYLRAERKFSGVQELVAQIHRDADEARSILQAMQK